MRFCTSQANGPEGGGVIRIGLFELIFCLSQALDLVSPAVVDHHRRVGWLAAELGRAMGLDPEDRADLLLAGMVHDAGAFSLKTRLDALRFESDGTAHAEKGWLLLVECPRLAGVAELVRLHHARWSEADGPGDRARLLGNVLFLADRTDALLGRAAPPAGRCRDVAVELLRHAGRLFVPDACRALGGLAAEPGIDERLTTLDFAPLKASLPLGDMGAMEVLDFTRMVSQVIDFRCRFTATHSRGVAGSAVMLASLAGLSGDNLLKMEIAGNLHDLGKLGVPAELVEKPGRLTDKEMATMRSHALISHRILAAVEGLGEIAPWAALHHERLDGRGYPFGFGAANLGLGARIVAVADVFTALTEDRPYRRGMTRPETVRVLMDMARAGSLDRDVVALVEGRFADLNEVRILNQEEALCGFVRCNASAA